MQLTWFFQISNLVNPISLRGFQDDIYEIFLGSLDTVNIRYHVVATFHTGRFVGQSYGQCLDHPSWGSNHITSLSRLGAKLANLQLF